jgi:hypothetical protein
MPDANGGSAAAATTAAAAAAAVATAAAAASAAALSDAPVHTQTCGTSSGSGGKTGLSGGGAATKLAKGASLGGLSELEGAVGTATLLSADDEDDCCPT